MKSNKKQTLYNVFFVIFFAAVLCVFFLGFHEALSLTFSEAVREEYEMFWGAEGFPMVYKSFELYITTCYISSVVSLYCLAMSLRFYKQRKTTALLFLSIFPILMIPVFSIGLYIIIYKKLGGV
jgi:ABC-type spermidine/putrescine transport system permease subunit I